MPLQRITVAEGFPPQPRVAAALGTLREDGGANFMALAWHTPIRFEPPLYGVVVGHDKASFELLRQWPGFTVTFMPHAAAGLLQALGSSSGADTDKVRDLALRLVAPVSGKVPLLADGWLGYECRVVDRHEHGDHSIFVGAVVASHADRRFWSSGELTPDARPLVQTNERLFCTLGPRRGPYDAD